MNIVSDSKDAMYANIRLQIHALEKVLVKGNIPKDKAIVNLLNQTEKLLKAYPDYGFLQDAVSEAIAISKSVMECKKAQNEDSRYIEEALKDFIDRNDLKEYDRKSITIKRIGSDDRPLDESQEYDSFVKKRHSVREFTSRVIDPETLNDIVSTALICPSACNRQSCKVYYTQTPEKIRKFFPDKYVTKDVYNLLIITVNKSFYRAEEVFAPWFDGGIFVESLIMAIHSRGLGACPFQYLKTHIQYQQFKDIIGIPDNEDIVCCVGLGYLKDEYSIIETHRRDAKDIIVGF